MNSVGNFPSDFGARHRSYRFAKGALFSVGGRPFLSRILQEIVVLVVVLVGAGFGFAAGNSDSSAVCQVHHKAMRVERIRERGGCVLPAPGYEEARSKLFPHASPEGWPDPRPWKFKRVYICDDCERAQKEWLRKQQVAHSSLKSPASHSHFRADISGPPPAREKEGHKQFSVAANP
jgi:hypothetical protein